MPKYWYSLFCKTMHITLQDAGVCLLLTSCRGCYVGSIYGEGLVANSVIFTLSFTKVSQLMFLIFVFIHESSGRQTDRVSSLTWYKKKNIFFLEIVGILFEMFSLFWWLHYLCRFSVGTSGMQCSGEYYVSCSHWNVKLLTHLRKFVVIYS
jgi:hypothetical protein